MRKDIPSLGVLKNGRADLAGPLAQLGLGRDGTLYVIAAGRANHAGRGEWKGITDGNGSFIGIEAESTGIGDPTKPGFEPWPGVQLDAYRRGVAAILAHLGQDAGMCCGHKEYALPKGRKSDPHTLDMERFRSEVAARQQAMFDWWERLFDYTIMRRESLCSPERPAWLLFHEAAETHVDNPAHLIRHLGIDFRHDSLVLQYFDAVEVDLSYDVTSNNLEDDRWAVRVWQAEKWVRHLLYHFYPKDIAVAKPFLWVSDGPALDGNANLAHFYRNGCIENGEPYRYKEIKF